MGNATENSSYPPELGPVISEERQSHLSAGLAIALSFGIGIGLAGGLYYFTGHWLGAVLLGCAIGGLGMTIAITAGLSGESGARFFFLHEHGVRLERSGQVQTMLFDQMESFVYARTRHYVNGSYIGDRIETKFVSQSVGTVKPALIVFSTSTKGESNPDLDYDLLVKMVSEPLSLKMAADLAQQNRIEWIPGCFIRKDGLDAPVKTLVNSSERFVPWAEVVDYELHNGQLLIAIDDSGKWRVKLDTSKPNFFPGFELFLKMTELSQSEQEGWDEALATASD